MLTLLKSGSSSINADILSESIFESVNSLSEFNLDPSRHFAVDELLAFIPPNIRHVGSAPYQGFLSNQQTHFQQAFAEIRLRAISLNSYIGIIITKPPETVCVILPPNRSSDLSAGLSNGLSGSSSSSREKYYLFDPHSRPQLGLEGAYLVSSEVEADILRRLNDLFPPLPDDSYDFDDQQGAGTAPNWGAMMYNMFDCWTFQFVQ